MVILSCQFFFVACLCVLLTDIIISLIVSMTAWSYCASTLDGSFVATLDSVCIVVSKGQVYATFP